MKLRRANAELEICDCCGGHWPCSLPALPHAQPLQLGSADCRRHGRAHAEAPGRCRVRRCELPLPDIFRLSGPALCEAAAALSEGGLGLLHGIVPRPQYRIGRFEQWRSPIPFLQPLGLEDGRGRESNRLLRHHRRARPPGPGWRGAPAALRIWRWRLPGLRCRS